MRAAPVIYEEKSEKANVRDKLQRAGGGGQKGGIRRGRRWTKEGGRVAVLERPYRER